MPLNFPSYIVHTILYYLMNSIYEESFQTDTSSRRGMLAGVDQGGLITIAHFNLCQRYAPTLAPRRVGP